MDSELITLEGIAEHLKCSRTTIWRKVKSGELPPPEKICGLTRWRKSALEAAFNADPAAPGAPRTRRRAVA